MKAVIQPLAWGLALASILAMASGVALDMVISTAHAAQSHHDHAGHSAEAPVTTGEQWQTDAPLREGMTRLQHAVETALAGNPAQPIGEAQAIQLQKDVETHVSYLIENCQLSEQADAALHVLLIDLLKGAEALSEPAERDQGVQRILASLHQYPELFAAPHWNEPDSHNH
ncbi:DnrO protein [Stutzerimonas stutzeri]|uniref:DnrO protein n=1 Tax=Stutzerimonas stutzeri TaxID=316 RepID=UPI00210922A4|nr:DnrO protein [Stutzerimonas stutzeri]MCQ4242169.1 DnrO protein [Stutzerimonas stutzeri]